MIGDRNICTWIDTDILRCVATRVVQREEFSIFFMELFEFVLFERFWILRHNATLKPLLLGPHDMTSSTPYWMQKICNFFCYVIQHGHQAIVIISQD